MFTYKSPGSPGIFIIRLRHANRWYFFSWSEEGICAVTPDVNAARRFATGEIAGLVIADSSALRDSGAAPVRVPVRRSAKRLGDRR